MKIFRFRHRFVFNFALFILAILVGSSPAARAQFLFTTNNGALTITGYTGISANLVIPAATNGYPVTAIGDLAFEGAGFTSVSIPNSITTLGEDAFYGCLGLTTVTIPASLTNLPANAFNFCYYLTNFTVDAANPAYSSANGVLFDKAQHALLQFPENSSLNNYVVPASVTSIGDLAFSLNRGLTNIVLPNGLTNIGYASFLGDSLFRNLVIPDTVTRLGDSSFAACAGLTNVVIGNGVTDIGTYTFNNCSSLAYPLVLPESVRNIGTNAFDSCSSLPGITFGSNVTNIGINALEFCSKLTSITVAAANPNYSSLDGVLFDKSQHTLIQFPTGLNSTYVLPATVTSISDNAFYGCHQLYGITLDTSLTNIGNYAFYGCYNLTSVTIPDSVLIVGGEAFQGCLDLNALSIGSNVMSIGAGAFYNCLQLTGVNIPASVIDIEDQAFDACPNLASITVAAGNPAYSATNGILFNKAQTTILQYPATVAGSYSIPATVNNIGNYAFNSDKLTGVTIPAGVTNIGRFAFYRDNITNLVLPDSLVTIGLAAFARAGVTNVIVPNNVTRIDDNAFQYCLSLTNIVFGSSLTNLGKSVFYGSTALKSAYFLGNAPANDGSAFNGDTHATVYYQPGTSGWGSTFGGIPAMLNPASQIIRQLQPAGIAAGHFSINLFGPGNSVVVVQAATNLANPSWVSLSTNTLSGTGTGTFQDPEPTGYTGRFYRLKP